MLILLFFGCSTVFGAEKWGFIDRAGKFRIPPKFDDATSFGLTGAALVKMGSRSIWIDTDGKAYPSYKVTPTDLTSFSPRNASSEIIMATEVAGRYRLKWRGKQYDPTKKWPWLDSLIPVKVGTKYGYIDKSGKLVIPAKFDKSNPFLSVGKSKLAAVKEHDRWAFIDQSGRYAIEPQFEDVGAFMEDQLAPAKKDGLWGYIDMTGKFIIEPKFLHAKLFRQGLGPVKVNVESEQ